MKLKLNRSQKRNYRKDICNQINKDYYQKGERFYLLLCNQDNNQYLFLISDKYNHIKDKKIKLILNRTISWFNSRNK